MPCAKGPSPGTTGEVGFAFGIFIWLCGHWSFHYIAVGWNASRHPTNHSPPRQWRNFIISYFNIFGDWTMSMFAHSFCPRFWIMEELVKLQWNVPIPTGFVLGIERNFANQRPTHNACFVSSMNLPYLLVCQIQWLSRVWYVMHMNFMNGINEWKFP